MPRMPRAGLVAIVIAVAAAGCSPASSPTASPSPTPTPTPVTGSPTPAASGFTITSEDFDDGQGLETWAMGSAFAGQCEGDNLNPHLEWHGAPEGTLTYAITMRDASAGDYVHWVHANIPAAVTSVERGASAGLEGVAGRTGISTTGYFGPCPPSSEHRYVFEVWALDAAIDFEEGDSFAAFFAAARDHVLDSAEISGMRGSAS